MLELSKHEARPFPRVSHEPRLFTVALQGNNPNLNKIMISGLDYGGKENPLFFTSKCKQWATTSPAIGTTLRLSHQRVSVGSVFLHLETRSVKSFRRALKARQAQSLQFLWQFLLHYECNPFRLSVFNVIFGACFVYKCFQQEHVL